MLRLLADANLNNNIVRALQTRVAGSRYPIQTLRLRQHRTLATSVFAVPVSGIS
jgi:hypothetical protein